MFIGLTGGIASGKSTVSKMVEDMGVPVIDADKVAREVVEPGSEALEKIRNHFGSTILNEDGTLARKKLGAIIFQDPKERQVLNGIVHPAVRKRMEEWKQHYLNEGHQTIVYDIPLLFESNLFHLVDKVIVVYVDYETQLKRLMERDQAGEQDAIQRIASQMPLAEKREQADYIIDNSYSLEETKKQLEGILKECTRKK
ncbi:dephospho-CoA kinase [Halalkalibacter krulwichiae]|uniref:Dephospho-CoA kinase n=1 Tax=Halalkalibacter krulwichiae TaxID=199441 RepID=A0A1X9MGP9_9BACI|nr:dephospho-CoA kinase [Halalkalibacter krulwichiae]ARK31690.1 Dephospho-CoA kinase [Halalkalibacter krulwichiae]